MTTKDNMDETVRVRLSPVDLAAWQRAADADHRTLSDWIRMRCEGLSATEPMPRLAERRQPPTVKSAPRITTHIDTNPRVKVTRRR